MEKIRDWVKHTNGWQRIWLVATMLALCYGLLINPFVQNNGGSAGRYDFKWAVEREMKNPACTDYMSKPFVALSEPEYNTDGTAGCWHIYTHRRYLDGNKAITEESYESHFVVEQWKNIGLYALMGLIVVLVLSSLVYGAGKVFAWVIGGFKKDQNP
jgi:hypothetical protein